MNRQCFLVSFMVLLPWCLCQTDDYVYPEEKLLHGKKMLEMQK